LSEFYSIFNVFSKFTEFSGILNRKRKIKMPETVRGPNSAHGLVGVAWTSGKNQPTAPVRSCAHSAVTARARLGLRGGALAAGTAVAS
jgi:hypothetical protein